MPDLFKSFPGTSKPRSNTEIAEMYAQGYAGAFRAPDSVSDSFKQTIIDTKGTVNADDACRLFGLEDTGKGKLNLTFPAIEKCYPGSIPGAGQDWGDCVSHGAKNAVLATMCNEIVRQLVDEITGKLEEAPKLSPEAIIDGVLSPEAIFWFRGRAGDGWFCEEASETVLKNCGTVLKQNYPDLGIDLTRYSLANSKKFGTKKPTGEIAEALKKNIVRTATLIDSWESFRDLTANGYGINTCGSEGFSDNRDANGVSKRQGSWAHSMATYGADDRPEVHEAYGGPLVLVAQSWGKGWGKGGKRILGTTIDIPDGCFWVKWADWKKRWMCAYSGHAGWPRQLLPNWWTAF